MKNAILLLLTFIVAQAVSAQQVRKDSFIILNSEPLFKHNYEKLKKQEAKKKIVQKEEQKVFVPSWLQKKYAEKMGVNPEDITNTTLYNFVEDWYGTRYVYGGTTRRGIDCSAFVQKMTDCVLGSKVVRTAAAQQRTTKYISKDSLQEGDLVFFKVNVSRISHVGVYLQNGYFAHASSSRGVMISSLNSGYWSRYYAAGGRVILEENN
jgi:cell wall-associated NlpC family hydrolase